MKILYLGQHGQANNDDEGAIAWALRELGHDVVCSNPRSIEGLHDISGEYDFMLFHKLPIHIAHKACTMWKSVLWYFDAIGKGFEGNDFYINSIIDNIDVGFFTDGDYAAGTMFHDLKQGYDSRYTACLEDKDDAVRDLVFIGTANSPGYEERSAYIDKLTDKFGLMAHTKYNIFKEALTTACHQTRVMLAMPPVSDRYWSNRVYLLGGRGACLAHPYSTGLKKELGDSIGYYNSFEELEELVRELADPFMKNRRMEMRYAVQKIVTERHCYINRCAELLSKV